MAQSTLGVIELRMVKGRLRSWVSVWKSPGLVPLTSSSLWEQREEQREQGAACLRAQGGASCIHHLHLISASLATRARDNPNPVLRANVPSSLPASYEVLR